MTKEDKELLLKDLSARLPYGVEADCVGEYVKIKYIDPHRSTAYISNLGKTKWESIEVITPYLRPMSSMTEEEREDFYQNVLDMDIEDVRYENDGKLPLPYNQKDKFIWFENIYLDNTFAVIDWLNAHHFDYRNLIEKALAIEVTEENNPYKNHKI